VEVGDKAAYRAEAIPGLNKKLCVSPARFDASLCVSRGFERTNDGGADSDDWALGVFCFVERARSFFRDEKRFRVEHVCFKIFFFEWGECAKSNMERHFFYLETLFFECGKK
jgi:hypothetical protein